MTLPIYWWARQYSVTDGQEEAEVSNATAIQVNKLLTIGSVACNSWILQLLTGVCVVT